jgi:hypothetical protein
MADSENRLQHMNGLLISRYACDGAQVYIQREQPAMKLAPHADAYANAVPCGHRLYLRSERLAKRCRTTIRTFAEANYTLVARTTTSATATLRILLILLLIIVLLILRPSPDSAWRWCSSLRRIIFMVWRL